MSGTPYFKFYPSDFLGDTMLLSAEAVGAYVLLLCAMWNAGGRLPNDAKKLAQLARIGGRKWPALWAELAPFFEVEPEFISHKRLTSERDKVGEISAVRSASGRQGGRAKSLKTQDQGQANASDLPDVLPEQTAGKEADTRARSNTRDQKPDLFSEPNGSGADRAPQDLGKKAWATAVQLLTTAGRMREPQARQFFGRLISENKLQAEDLLPALAQAEVSRTQDPQSYLRKAAQGVARRQAGRPAPSSERVDLDWI